MHIAGGLNVCYVVKILKLIGVGGSTTNYVMNVSKCAINYLLQNTELKNRTQTASKAQNHGGYFYCTPISSRFSSHSYLAAFHSPV